MNKTSFGTITKVNIPIHGQCDFLTFFEKGREHHHNSKESFFVTNGEGLVFIDGNEFVIKKGDSMTISENSKHFMKPNDGEILELILWYHD